jgi:hypothetical protein
LDHERKNRSDRLNVIQRNTYIFSDFLSFKSFC